MTLDNETLSRLGPRQRQLYEEQSRQMTPTLMRLRFGNVEALAQKTDAAMQLASVAKGARTAFEQIHATHWRSMTDETVPEAARLVRSATHAKQQLQRIASRYESALNATNAKMAELHARIETQLRPPQHAGLAAVAVELRTYIRSLDPTAVMGVIRSDPKILDAVVTAPAMLTGVAPENWAKLRAEYLTATIPDEFEQYNDLQEAIKAASVAHTELTKETKRLVDFETATALQNRKVAADAA